MLLRRTLKRRKDHSLTLFCFSCISAEEDAEGTEDVKRALLGLYCKLSKRRKSNGGSLVKTVQASPVSLDKQAVGVITQVLDADSENLL